MKGIELLEKYPDAAKVISEFYNNKLIESMDTEELTEEFKEVIKSQEFDNQYVATFIDSNPRFLFDVFDAHDVYVEISVTLTPEDVLFKYSVNGEVSERFYDFRKTAEKEAIEKAFEILNDKLCQIK